MRNLEQRTMYAHGTAFIVRRVPSAGSYHVRRWYNHERTQIEQYGQPWPAGYVIFAPSGKYLARVRPDQLKRWLNYFGKQVLTHSR